VNFLKFSITSEDISIAFDRNITSEDISRAQTSFKKKLLSFLQIVWHRKQPYFTGNPFLWAKGAETLSKQAVDVSHRSKLVYW